jgi:malonate-semialdehyde dehydrogenase (acetylating)/methylmalonate-semialdehyde dehydrogenase
MEVLNYIRNEWQQGNAAESLPVHNPATGEELGRTPISSARDVDQAVQAAAEAFTAWRRVPVTDRVQFLFKLKMGLEQQFEELARTITEECGKTLGESRGELRRAIENVEVACGAPIMIQGYNSEDIAAGIDEIMIRQPLGVCAIIAPFNFPAMIPFWFLPYAIAAGNTVVLKPSERVPLTMQKVF